MRLILAGFLAAFLTGCVHVSKPVALTSKPEEGMAYFYGKFKLDDTSSNMDIVLILHNTDDIREKKKDPYKKKTVTRYGLRFEKNNEVYTIAVKPGSYKIHGFEYGTGGELQKSNDSLSESNGLISKEFTIKPGEALYLGDWYGSGSISSSYMTTHYSWKLDQISFNFDETTQLFKQRYLQFADLNFSPAYQLDYSPEFDRKNPDTYNVADLKKAVGYSENDLALKMAEHLQDKEPDAKAYLGYFYYKGIQVEKDINKAMTLLKESVDQKSVVGMWQMSYIYNDMATYFSSEPEKQQNMRVYAFMLVERAAAMGDPKAIAFQCKVFSESEKTNLFNYGRVWCDVGRKILNDDNKEFFEDTSVVLADPLTAKDRADPEFVKVKEEVKEKLMKNSIHLL